MIKFVRYDRCSCVKLPSLAIVGEFPGMPRMVVDVDSGRPVAFCDEMMVGSVFGRFEIGNVSSEG